MTVRIGDDDVHVIGVGIHPPQARNTSERLEEIVWKTSRAALERAGVTRSAIDLLVIGANDELDGRSISSMLLAAPAGGFLKDEIKVSDSGAMAFCLAVARILSGEFDLGVVASWCKPSKTDVDSVFSFGAEPFATRPIGLTRTSADGLLAQALAIRWDLEEAEITDRILAAYERAARNLRGMRHPIPGRDAVESSPLVATPLREMHQAPLSDGAVSLVLASGRWLRRHAAVRSLARVRGVGWAAGSYRLDAQRLQELGGLRPAWEMAMRGTAPGERPDVVELDAQSAFEEAALVRALDLGAAALSPSGGPFAQNPLVCTGLVNIAEAALQVAGEAGAVQVPGARLAVAHGSHGLAAQSHVFAVLEAGGLS